MGASGLIGLGEFVEQNRITLGIAGAGQTESAVAEFPFMRGNEAAFMLFVQRFQRRGAAAGRVMGDQRIVDVRLPVADLLHTLLKTLFVKNITARKNRFAVAQSKKIHRTIQPFFRRALPFHKCI